MTLLLKWRKSAHVIQDFVFKYIKLISFVLYLMTLFGVSLVAPAYLKTIDNLLKLYICAFLLIRFNPLRQRVVFTSLDKSIIFTAALMLLTGTFLGAFLPDFLVHLDI